ncbi:MAG: hypothetical protein AVDCRST_MAG22-756, partial [uncultured Rubrobacteraceae bacterium]
GEAHSKRSGRGGVRVAAQEPEGLLQ